MKPNLALAESTQSPEADSAPEWFSAAELAALALPGLPADKGSLNRRAKDESWRRRVGVDGAPLARARVGRGGGTEYHVSLLPGAALIELARRGLAEAPTQATPDASPAAASWRWYEAQSGKTKAEAERRIVLIGEIETLRTAGLTATAAIAEIARTHGVGRATLWQWLTLIEGVARADRLPALAPRRQGGGAEVSIDPLLWSLFESDYLRLSAPTLAACFDRTALVARERGLSMPSEKTFRRRIAAIDPGIVLLRRGGAEALRRSVPSQRRSVAELSALEVVNIDGHKFDVFVAHPETGAPIRPIMVAIQDIHSRKFLSWRVGTEESAVQTRLAFADLLRDWGVPAHCVLDNGRAFASKWITGGAKSRFRFKIKAEEPTGLLTALGVQIHWALPYRGQSKPIERGFRDLCETIAKHPAMEGAYTGNSPLAKPENYGSRAIGWAAFIAHVNAGMAAHNAKLGRRTETARGLKSFDQVFAESYAAAPIGRASPEQLRMALLAAEQKTIDRRTGEIELMGNRYWAEGCARYAGQKVAVRFDPDDLMQPVHLYGQDGRYLLTAELLAATGFLTAAGAQAAGKRLSDYRRRVREGAEAEQLISAAEVARLQAVVDVAEPVQPSVIRPVRHRGQSAAALKPAAAPAAPQHESRVFAALGQLRAVD